MAWTPDRLGGVRFHLLGQGEQVLASRGEARRRRQRKERHVTHPRQRGRRAGGRTRPLRQ
jgi:hypothetical protein